MSELSSLALDYAIKEIGNEEIPRGSNWGVHVQKYLASVGIGFPASWCMAFVYWCFEEAASDLKIQSPLFKTGGVLHEWNDIDTRLKTTTPQIGSIFIMDFGGGLGHCGFVENVDGTWLHTIDGNTNDTGSREGFEVCRKVRNSLKCKGFINI